MLAYLEATLFGFVPDPSKIPNNVRVPVEKWAAMKVSQSYLVMNKNGTLSIMRLCFISTTYLKYILC